jgi:hypothetical protein
MINCDWGFNQLIILTIDYHDNQYWGFHSGEINGDYPDLMVRMD